MPAILKKFASTAVLKNCLGNQVVFMWFHPVRLETDGKGKTMICNWLGILQKVNKIYFFSQAIIYATILNASISEFEACLTQYNMAQEEGGKRGV